MAPRVVYTTVQGPKLHLDVSGQKLPTCITPIEVSTPQGSELQMDVPTLERPVLLLEVSIPQHRGLYCTWTCLDLSSLCCSCTYLHCRYLCCTQNFLHTVSELHLDLSSLQSPVLHLDGFPLYRALS